MLHWDGGYETKHAAAWHSICNRQPAAGQAWRHGSFFTLTLPQAPQAFLTCKVIGILNTILQWKAWCLPWQQPPPPLSSPPPITHKNKGNRKDFLKGQMPSERRPGLHCFPHLINAKEPHILLLWKCPPGHTLCWQHGCWATAVHHQSITMQIKFLERVVTYHVTAHSPWRVRTWNQRLSSRGTQFVPYQILHYCDQLWAWTKMTL